jgi:hypothetical protein
VVDGEGAALGPDEAACTHLLGGRGVVTARREELDMWILDAQRVAIPARECGEF